ncbi:MAG: alpha/beta fold hydrolase [Myxococcota bacterium]
MESTEPHKPNCSPEQTAVLIHGAWTNSSCWEWLVPDLATYGISCLSPDWPFKGTTVEALNRDPDDRLATLGVEDIVAHYARIIRTFKTPPILIGHSFGGLITQMLLDRGLGRAAVALCPAPPRGVLPLHPMVMRTSMPIFMVPFGWRKILRLKPSDWAFGFVHDRSPDEQSALYERCVVPESGRIWYELGLSLMNGLTGVSFDRIDRGPLLMVGASLDRVTPASLVRSAARRYRAPTDFHLLEGHTHFVLDKATSPKVAELIAKWAAPILNKEDDITAALDIHLPKESVSRHHAAAIVGAGPAGLAVAAQLKQRGVDAVLLEAENDVGQSWRKHYDRLRLHTTRALSGLPGLPIPASFSGWVAAQDFATYCERYAREHGLQVATNTRALSISRGPDGWQLETTKGRWTADAVVVATGLNREPSMPEWPGRESFEGELIHSSQYTTAADYAGRDVLIVGTGNSASEIATDLAEGDAAKVRVSVRTPPNILPRSIMGLPSQVPGVLFGWMPAWLMDWMIKPIQWFTVGHLARFGFGRPARGVFGQVSRNAQVPIMDTGFVAQIRKGRIQGVAAVESCEGRDVILADGSRIQPDVVVAGTGFKPSLQSILPKDISPFSNGLPKLDKSAQVVGQPGLYLAGFLVSVSGVIREISIQATRVAAAIANGRNKL